MYEAGVDRFGTIELLDARVKRGPGDKNEPTPHRHPCQPTAAT